MPAVTPYQRLKNFTQYALDHTSAPYNPSDHDAELNAIAVTLSGLVTNLALIQRADGLIANQTVHPDAFTAAAKALIGAGSTGNLNWTPRGLWLTATQYNVGDVVEQGGSSYVCSAAHVSGVFATDHAAGRWVFLGGMVISLAASAVTVTPVGNIASTDAQSAFAELDAEKALLAGSSTQVFSVAAATALAHAARLAQVQDNAGLWFIAGAGTGNAITGSLPNSVMTGLTDGFECNLRAPGANSITNPTFALTLGSGGGAVATGAKTILRGDNGGALIVGDIAGATHELKLRYRQSVDSWLLLNPANTPISVSGVPSQQGLVDFLHLDSNKGHRDLIRGGWLPAFFNQQWGGSPHYFELVDTSTGTPYKFEAATGYIEQVTSGIIGGSYNVACADAAARTWQAQGFKVARATTLSAVWLKIAKTGNPTNNLTIQILPDSGSGTTPNGTVPITNGTATVQSGKLHSADTNVGQWVRFVFPTPPALLANTQYWITVKSSAAVDGSNYWNWFGSSAGKYPYGNQATGDGTPTWTATAGTDLCFLCEVADESLQSGGIFNDGKLTFFEGTPLNQSNARAKDLRDFVGFDLTDFTLAIYGNGWTKDRTILDIQYGMDHDRIVLRCNTATGYAQIDLYDSSGNKKTVTGTTDVSAGNSLLAIRVRAKGDGNDKVELWENGAKNAASLSAQTISFDKLFGQSRIGTFWLGGGWVVAPAWSGSSISLFTGLPSTLGWTYGGAATEALAFSVSGNRLYQNKNGYTALQDGYYRKTAAGLTNATGWGLIARARASSTTWTKDAQSIGFTVEDGSKNFGFGMQEFYGQTFSGATNYYPQQDLKIADSVVNVTGKGSDAMVFINGRYVVDATGQVTTASGNNQITIGDQNTSSGENADAIHSYWKYLTTGQTLPQFTSGALSEMALWSGDRTTILASLWNSGTPISVKQLCGINVNHGPEVPRVKKHSGVTSGPTIGGGASEATANEMEMYAVGTKLSVNYGGVLTNNASSGTSVMEPSFDGLTGPSDLSGNFIQAAAANATWGQGRSTRYEGYFGLHRVDCRWYATGGTGTLNSRSRSLEIESRV